jgi:DNA-binding transcriptional LysR family regulator
MKALAEGPERQGLALIQNKLLSAMKAEGLKAMALEGQGVAYLPASAVAHDVERGRLQRVAQAPEVDLEVRIYRQRARHGDGGPAGLLWSHLAQHAAVSAGA